MKKLPLTRPVFDDRERKMLDKCLASGWVTQGPLVAQFETNLSDMIGVPHALATTSCTAALHMSVLAADIGPGDEIVVPSFTWVTSAHCAEYAGATPVFCDVDPATFNLDPASLRSVISPRTKAILVVHLFGQAAPMGEIMEIADTHNLLVIEDAACAIGTTWQGRHVGSFGFAGCFSFHPRKVITTGEGGLVTTSSQAVADRIAILRNHGTGGSHISGPDATPSPWHFSPVAHAGFNLRMSDINAAVGLAQLDKLEGLLAERRGWAERYHASLADNPDVIAPMAAPDSGHTYQSYVVRIAEGGEERRNAVMQGLADAGIFTRPGTYAVHATEFYREKYAIRPEDFPNSLRCQQETITLPIFPGMTDQDFDCITSNLEHGLGQRTL